MNTELFFNDYYKLLKLMYDNQAVVLSKNTIPLTQGEMSLEMGISKAKINILLNKLMEDGYIAKETRGKYVLLEKARVFIEELSKIEDEMGML